MKRRTLVNAMAGLTASAAAGMAVVLVASGMSEPRTVPGHASQLAPGYMPGMDMPGMDLPTDAPTPGDAPAQAAAVPSASDVYQLPDGTWKSTLLPLTQAFPTRAALERALAKARKEGRLS